MDAAGKNIIITGGGRGMGKQFALDLKELGAKPFVLDVIQDDLDKLKNETNIPGKIIDVTHHEYLMTYC